MAKRVLRVLLNKTGTSKSGSEWNTNVKRIVLFLQHQSWTDDLPLCQMCGVGTAPNCVYGPDGKGTQSHTNEDGHLRFR